jgi:hypothetical protein
VPSGYRRWLFALLVVGCVAAIAVAVVSAAREADPDDVSASEARALLTGSPDGERPVVVRDLRDGAHGRIAVAARGGAAEPTQAPLRCDRVYFAHRVGLCLAPGGGFASGYRARVFGPDLEVRHELAVEGIPSRARVSPDGRYGAVTLFVTGHAYAEAGEFSTQTTLIDLERGTKIAGLEQFTVTDRDDRQITAVDMNFWGVTFAGDSDRFYATLATGGKTYLIEGSVAEQAAHVVHENVECPSLSPDGKRIAYKKRVDSDSGLWRLTVLDLDTMRETPLAETRSVDDQAEWLDDERVAYGVDRDVFVVPADGSGEPRRLIRSATSPAAVRD